MALASGLGAQIAYVAESVYGTRVAPTRFLEFTEESLSFDPGRRESQGLRAGQNIVMDGRWEAGRKMVTGNVKHSVADTGFGLLLKHMLGAVATSQPDSSGSPLTYEHAATLGDMKGKSMTIQVGRPDITGTSRPFDYLGCKIASWSLSQALDGDLELELTIDGQDEDTAQTLATPSYPTEYLPFGWEQLAVTVDGSAFDVRSFTLEGDNALKTDRFFVGDRTKKEPLGNDFVAITGEMQGDFESMTAYNRVRDGDVVAVTANWTGSLIEDSYHYAVEINLPAVRFDSENPQVGGPDILSQDLKFKVLDDGTNEPITITYRTTDTTP